MHKKAKIFYGWWVAGASFFTLGLAVGLPYFGMPFFYDYFEKPIESGGFGWSKSVITLGLPLGTLLTIWAGPALVHRFAPRRMILVGTGITAAVLAGFGLMGGSVAVYWGLWVLYMIGNILSGGVSHQVIVSRWFVRHRGTALAIGYLGISLVGAFSARFVVRPLTEWYGYRTALMLMGGLVLLTWPVVWLVMREGPEELGMHPDGEAEANSDRAEREVPTGRVWRDKAFAVLLIGGSLSVGAVGAVSQHLKLIMKDGGFAGQSLLDDRYSRAMMILLAVSAVGRLIVGRLADRVSKLHIWTGTVLLFSASMPFLIMLEPPETPWLFAVLFGLSMGGDFLLVALLAADRYSGAELARALGILLPVMTVGQTWFPYLIALIREWTGSYSVPLGVILLTAVAGRAAMLWLPAGGFRRQVISTPRRQDSQV